MTDAEIQARMAQQLWAAQTPLGRWRLRVYVRWKRWLWVLVTGAAHAIKRLADILVSLITIIFLSPIFFVVAILIRMDGGPVFFGQTRFGLHGREFKILKIRSTVPESEARLKDLLALNEKNGVTFKIKHDPRITRIGRILRKSSLDEIPQFWNVLKDEMSLVGPRPPVKRDVDLYTPLHHRCFLVNPGITCLRQVGERHGGRWEIGDRNTFDFEEQVQLDVHYIESQSFWKDLWILLKTVPTILSGKGT